LYSFLCYFMFFHFDFQFSIFNINFIIINYNTVGLD